VSPAAHALDRRIYELRSAREAVVGSIAALQSDGTWSLLAAGLAGDSLTGTTAERARPAIVRVTELQQGLDLVAQLVDHVVALRDAGTSDERRTTELVALLNSPAILVPTDVPWMEHVLPPPPEDRAVTAQLLLDEMEGALAPARQLVAEVDAAWQAFLPRLERVSAEADQAAAEAPGNRAITDVRVRLAALADLVVDDPIGARERRGAAEGDLQAAAGLRSEVSRLQSDLSDALALLATIEETISSGRQALGQSRAEIASPSGLLDPLDPSTVSGDQGLRPWIVRLERLVAQGDVARASQGLERWSSLAASTLAAAEQVAAANSSPLAERSSLLGLLRAARVKAGAAGRAEDLVLASLADAAERALAVPADLVEAQAHVDAYLDELRRPGVGGSVSRPARGSAARVVGSDVDPWAGVPVGGAPAVVPVGADAVDSLDPWSEVAPPPESASASASPPATGVDPWSGVAAGAGSAPARRHADLDQRTGDDPVLGADDPPRPGSGMAGQQPEPDADPSGASGTHPNAGLGGAAGGSAVRPPRAEADPPNLTHGRGSPTGTELDPGPSAIAGTTSPGRAGALGDGQGPQADTDLSGEAADAQPEGEADTLSPGLADAAPPTDGQGEAGRAPSPQADGGSPPGADPGGVPTGPTTRPRAGTDAQGSERTADGGSPPGADPGGGAARPATRPRAGTNAQGDEPSAGTTDDESPEAGDGPRGDDAGGPAGAGGGGTGGAGRWERPAEPPRRDPATEAGTDVWKEMSA
jgi:hypothetical protein